MSDLKLRINGPKVGGVSGSEPSTGATLKALQMMLTENRSTFGGPDGKPLSGLLDPLVMVRQSKVVSTDDPATKATTYDAAGERVRQNALPGDRLLERDYGNGNKTLINLSLGPNGGPDDSTLPGQPREQRASEMGNGNIVGERMLRVIGQADPKQIHGEAMRLQLVDDLKSRLASMHQQQMDIIRSIR